MAKLGPCVSFLFFISPCLLAKLTINLGPCVPVCFYRPSGTIPSAESVLPRTGALHCVDERLIERPATTLARVSGFSGEIGRPQVS